MAFFFSSCLPSVFCLFFGCASLSLFVIPLVYASLGVFCPLAIATMDECDRLLNNVLDKSCVNGLQVMLNNVEMMDEQLSANDKLAQNRIKNWCVDAGQKMNQRCSTTIRGSDDILRLYKIIGKYSRTPPTRLFDTLEQANLHSSSLKFHVAWAEAYAKSGNLSKFKEIMATAEERVGRMHSHLSNEFRAVAEDNFEPAQVEAMFPEDEPTMNVFGKLVPAVARKARRRSHVVQLGLQFAPASTEAKQKPVAAGQKMIFNQEYSIEEKLTAMYLDRLDKNLDDVDMEISMLNETDVEPIHPVPIENPVLNPAVRDVEPVPAVRGVIRKSVYGRMVAPAQDAPKREDLNHVSNKAVRDRMSALDESETEDRMTREEEELKRRRFYSPVVPTKESHLIRNLNKNESVGRSVSPTSRRAASSALSGASFNDNVYNNAAAMFSDTLVFPRATQQQDLDDCTMPVEPKPSEKFEVFVDETAIIDYDANSPAQKRTSASKDTVSSGRRPLAPLSDIDVIEENKKDVPLPPRAFRFGAENNANDTNLIEYEETLAGVRFGSTTERPLSGIITSTPAHNSMRQPTHEDFFRSNEDDDEGEEDMDDLINELEEEEETVAGNYRGNVRHTGIASSTPAEFVLGAPSVEDFFKNTMEVNTVQMMDHLLSDDDDVAESAFMKKAQRRQSIAKLGSHSSSAAPVAPIPPARTYTEKSMENALGKMNLASLSDEKITSNDMEDEEDEGILNKTGIGRPEENIVGTINPWDVALREKIMGRYRKPTDQHEFNEDCPTVRRQKTVVLGGEVYRLHELLGEGGFAKVYRCTDDSDSVKALKYEVPSCAFESFICDQLRLRLSILGTPGAAFASNCVMHVSDAYIFKNASLLINDYIGHGTLLNVSNKVREPSWQLVLLLGIHMAKVLKEVHEVGIIHGDAKPDNFMLLTNLSESANVDELLETPLVKLIDWGRAIDMRTMNGCEFQGKAGTANFDCPAMVNGEKWTYHTDYFGWVSSLHVIMFQAYCTFITDHTGSYMVQKAKRRFPPKDMLESIFAIFLNISDCKSMPGWDSAIDSMTDFFRANFKASEWRAIATKFNELIKE